MDLNELKADLVAKQKQIAGLEQGLAQGQQILLGTRGAAAYIASKIEALEKASAPEKGGKTT